MFQKFYPSEDIRSTYDIDFERYYKEGYRGVIFDVDNTLVPHNAPADERAKKLFKRLDAMGMQYCFTSNNKEPRVKAFCEAVGGKHYVYKANKPSIKGYETAMKLMGTDKKNTFFVGDQLFTDVYGANRTGIHSILVTPMNPKEEIQIVIKRYFEKIVLWQYRKKNINEIIKNMGQIFVIWSMFLLFTIYFLSFKERFEIKIMILDEILTF